ncbi:hypothetical protein NDU88_006661 [Pleurodeles waltl]|uniref:Uncharacterized protein n=1 Tax=Pleurodeles waltl TaxID=8319 RepID=A0AAV7ULN4_PLEWA|nr:hypothetical protein NDU88_006661 [Pleurodeles waltl]
MRFCLARRLGRVSYPREPRFGVFWFDHDSLVDLCQFVTPGSPSSRPTGVIAHVFSSPSARPPVLSVCVRYPAEPCRAAAAAPGDQQDLVGSADVCGAPRQGETAQSSMSRGPGATAVHQAVPRRVPQQARLRRNSSGPDDGPHSLPPPQRVLQVGGLPVLRLSPVSRGPLQVSAER